MQLNQLRAFSLTTTEAAYSTISSTPSIVEEIGGKRSSSGNEHRSSETISV